MEYKAIETEYNGIVFRSKNEAKWAHFFDLAGISWEYESQCFAGHNNTKYKPDFYFPKYDKFAEVKSSAVAIQEDNMRLKINGAIDYNATEVSNGLLLLGNFPFDIRIMKGLYLESDWLFWYKGVCSGRAIISRSIFGSNGNIEIKFIEEVTDCGDPIPASAKTETRAKQNQHDDSETLYQIIQRTNEHFRR